MLCDQPIVDYNTKKGMGNSAKDKKEMEDLVEAWKKKKEKQNKEGNTFSLNEFMKKKP